MDVLKLIGEVCGAQRDALSEKALMLDHLGADELLYLDKGSLEQGEEVDVKAVKAIAKASSLPINVIAGIHRFEDVKKLIYAGAKRVILPTEGWDNLDAVKEASGRFGADRIYLLMKPDKETNDHEQCLLRARVALEEEGFGGLFLQGDVSDICYVRTADFLKYKVKEPVMIQSHAGTNEELLTNVKLTLASAIALMDGSLDDLMAAKLYLKQNGIETETFELKISFDDFKMNSDGMIPVIAQDYKTNEVLMLAYMTKESFQKTIETGKMCYYSRSRQELWTKGDTSGHYQYVKSLTLDCDNDTILARVAQVGAACHTGNRTCFFKPLIDRENKTASALSVLEDVSETIADRREHPKEGSYTTYLFEKGIDKILKKVGEEAAEIIIAAKNPDSDELKYEICDFLYHMMVLMEERNVDWKQITEELAARH